MPISLRFVCAILDDYNYHSIFVLINYASEAINAIIIADTFYVSSPTITLIHKLKMSFAHCCKQCTCWCLFALSTLIMLLMTSLALNDMALIAGQQTLLEHIINTPLSQLGCPEICEVWYTQQNSGLCCDRYNMDLCVQKEQCKKDYVRNSQMAVQVLGSDRLHQMTISVVCGLIMIMVAFRKGKKVAQPKVQQEIDVKMVEMMKKAVEEVRKEKLQSEQTVIVPTFGSSQLLNNPPSKMSEISTLQDNGSFISQMMSDSISCPQVSRYLKNHSCQSCSYNSPNKR